MGYRILSMDGGGSWALIEIRALIELYGNAATGHDVLKDFDLVVGNSGGAMVMGGLLENLPLKVLLGYYETESMRRTLFSPTSKWYDRLLSGLIGIGPKYSTENKFAAIKQLLPNTGGLHLDQAAKGRGRGGADLDLLIIGFDYDANRSAFFRSAPTKGPEWGHGAKATATLAEAIHASTNAPVNYFDGPAVLPSGGRYWDGGITGCNNPVLAGVTEAIGKGKDPGDVVALSIGTGTVVLPPRDPADPKNSPFVQPPGDTGLLADIKRLATAIMDDPPDIATFLAYVMTGQDKGIKAPGITSRIVRINPQISPEGAPGSWGPPGPLNTQQFIDMVKLDADVLDQYQVNKIIDYTKLWIAGDVPNQAIREDALTLAVELGHDKFKQAVGAWQQLLGSY
jgi:patatin-like phospholipase